MPRKTNGMWKKITSKNGKTYFAPTKLKLAQLAAGRASAEPRGGGRPPSNVRSASLLLRQWVELQKERPHRKGDWKIEAALEYLEE